MKKYIVISLLSGIMLLGCGGDTKNAQKSKKVTIEKRPIALIPEHYGLEKFNQLDTLAFTFNVKKGEKMVKRHWIWSPKTQKITSIIGQDTFSFFQNNLDSLSIPYNKKFVNDSYWMLFPFHLAWDKDFFDVTYGKDVAPISGATLSKISIQYKKEGGYTPGDRYDIYWDANLDIKEWSYFKEGDLSKSLHVTWDKPITKAGVTISTFHKTKADDFELWFDNIVFK